MYGSDKCVSDMDTFFEEGWHKVKWRDQMAKPIPYQYQYDFEVHCFLNYYKMIREEVIRLHGLLATASNSDQRKEILSKIADVKKNGVTGIPRVIHLLHACEIRWPTWVDAEGAHRGEMVRTPWMELILGEVCRTQNVIAYGGGGQGKTHIFVAALCVMFDHFQGTLMGGKCSFSTINKDKMDAVTWPRIVRLYTSTEENISLYAGIGEPGPDHTIFRQGGKKSKDTANVIKGYLVGGGVGSNDRKIIDKLTGVHGHPLYAYLIDEMQSTPEAPITASANFLSTAPIDMGFLFGSGNWGDDADQLGKNTIPVQGWSSVDLSDKTTVYDSKLSTGKPGSTIYLCNDDSPAMTPDGAKKWGHMLPSIKRRDFLYPDIELAKRTQAYNAFWLGRRRAAKDSEAFCNSDLIKEGLCDRKVVWDGPPTRYLLSFDSAPAGWDRSPLLHAQDGIDKITGKRVINLDHFDCIHCRGQLEEYHSESAEQIVKIAKSMKVPQRNGITVDWTSVNAFPETFARLGYDSSSIRYQISLPGAVKYRQKRADEPPILLDFVEEKDPYNEDKVIVKERWAHEVCVNHISLGAFLLSYFLRTGRITGFSNELFRYIGASEHRTFEEEFCMRKLSTVTDKRYGERRSLQDKKQFKKDYGFSTDYLDCIMQLMVTVFLHFDFNPFLMDCPWGPGLHDAGTNKETVPDLDDDDDEMYLEQMGLIWDNRNSIVA